MSQSEGSAEPRFDGSVAAAVPLALLESVRAHDHPGEVLEDEDLSVSLPRRLGLTGVVETQIMRYESAQRSGRSVPLAEVVNLIRLVLRRPDANPILRETGQRIARSRFRRTPGAWTALLHRAPGVLGLRSARRAAVRALRSLNASDSIQAAKPFSITAADCLMTRLEPGTTACTLLTGLMEEQLLLYTGRPYRVSHTDCRGNGAHTCEWTLVEPKAEGE